jgi:hypothetical protein
MKTILLTTIFILALSVSALAQTPHAKAAPKKSRVTASPQAAALLVTITELDRKLFDAFNTRNLEVMKAMFATDAEFYHDKDGLSDYKQLVEAFTRLFEQSKTNGLKRELVKGSLEVYPIKDYGAMQIGEHRFCHLENGKQDCGTFKFVHIWRQKDGKWQITRVISYGH